MIAKMPDHQSGYTMSRKTLNRLLDHQSGYTMSRKTLNRLLFRSGSDYNQVYSTEMLNIDLEKELESFQYQVFSQFKTLSDSTDGEFLSLNWLSNLLEAFVACHQEFREFLLIHKAEFSKPPLNKLLKDFFDKSVKALDICNAVCDGIDKIRCSHKYLQIVSDALNSKHKKLMSRGQIRRARKALTNLANVMLENNKDSGRFFSRKLKSFGHTKIQKESKDLKRSISWSVSTSWSASKQLQSMANSLILPRTYEITATQGLANVVYTMGFVQMFVLWALVAAIPCQDRGLHTNFSIPYHFLWATPLSVIHIRIINESKKRDRKNSFGLLKEIHQMEKSVRSVTNLVDSFHEFPLTEEEKKKVKLGIREVSRANKAFQNWLYPLECQVRQMFHRIVSCRLEGLENL